MTKENIDVNILDIVKEYVQEILETGLKVA